MRLRFTRLSRLAHKITLALLACLILLPIAVAAGDLPRELRRIDPLAEASLVPEEIDFPALRIQAEQAANKGKLLDAARIYLYIVRRHAGDGRSFYNLACCYARLEQPEAAARYLVQALKTGPWDFGPILADPDWDKVRAREPFAGLLAQLTTAAEYRGETIWVPSGKLLPCRVRLPKGFVPGRNYPLIVALHGHGGNPAAMMEALARTGPLQAIVAAPEGAYPMTATEGRPGFSWEVASRDRAVWKMGDPLTVEYLAGVVDELRRRYRISRVFLLGHSQGAAYALMTGIKHPGLASGVVSVGGRLPEIGDDAPVISRQDATLGKALRVLALRGEDDPLVPAEAGEKIAATLTALGYDARAQAYPGDHALNEKALRLALNWMELAD